MVNALDFGFLKNPLEIGSSNLPGVVRIYRLDFLSFSLSGNLLIVTEDIFWSYELLSQDTGKILGGAKRI